MLNFIMLTISIALGILLAMVMMVVLLLQPKVMKLYAKFVMKSMNNMIDITNDETKDL